MVWTSTLLNTSENYPVGSGVGGRMAQGAFAFPLLDAHKTSNYSEPGNVKVVNPNQP